MHHVFNWRAALLSLSVFVLWGCNATTPRQPDAAAQSPYGHEGAPMLASAADSAMSAALQPMKLVSSVDEYVIGPHDLLEISVFQVEELSRDVRVNSRGNFSLPLIGVVQASGLTSAEIEADIAAKLGECCLQNPQVSIFIKEFVSQRVTVEGDVQKPGVYPLTGRTTLLQAIAMASGSAELADLSDVRVFRQLKDGTVEQLQYNVNQIRAGKTPDPQIQGNDVVVIGRSGSLSLIKGVTDTLRGFIGFGTMR
jgi:polysaccharide biosynthesis/export protein